MKKLVQIIAKPLNYSIIESDKSKTGKFIKIEFLVEVKDENNGNYYGDKACKVLEIFDTLTDDYKPLMDKTIQSVRLAGVYNNYKFTLTGFDELTHFKK